jgi:hypothetical protein
MCTKLELCDACYEKNKENINLKKIGTSKHCFGGYTLCDGCGAKISFAIVLHITNENIEQYSDPLSEFSNKVTSPE